MSVDVLHVRQSCYAAVCTLRADSYGIKLAACKTLVSSTYTYIPDAAIVSVEARREDPVLGV